MAIYDRLLDAGRALFSSTIDLQNERQPVKSLMEEKGESGTPNYRGMLQQDFNPAMRGQQAIDTFEEMRRTDAMINATLRALKLPILSAERSVMPVDAESEEEIEIAEFVRMNLEEHLQGGFRNFLREALAFKDFGFYYFEKVYEARDGQLWIKKLAPRQPNAHLYWPYEAMEGDQQNGNFIVQQLPGTSTSGDNNPQIPFSKCVVFVNEMEGENWDGVSVLRSAYKHWYIKDTLYRIDAIKHERGAGILKIVLPKGATDTDRDDAKTLGKHFKQGENSYIVQPNPEWQIDLLTNGIKEQSSSLAESIRHHNRMIAMNIQAQFLDLGDSETGSFALSKDQTSFFMLGLRETANYIAEVINKQLIEELVRVNFGEREEYPKLVFAKIGQVDFKEMAETLEKLVNTGIVDNSPELRTWAADTFGLPKTSVEDESDVEPDEPEPVEEPEEEIPEPEEVEAGRFAQKKKISRPLTLAEERVKFADIERDLNSRESRIRKILKQISVKQREEILVKVAGIIDQADPAGIQNLTLGIDAIDEQEIKAITREALEEGKRNAANELNQPLPTTPPIDRQVVDIRVDKSLETRNQVVLDGVKAATLAMILAGIATKRATNEVKKAFNQAATDQMGQITGTLPIAAINQGRDVAFRENKQEIHAMQRSEILDGVTCAMCLTLDGRVLSKNDPFTQLDAVHTNCRGIWVPILKTDAELPKAKKLPKSVLNRFDRKANVPTINNFEQVKKPIIRKNSRLQQRIEDGAIENPNLE